MIDLTGKAALVTGGSRGVGAAAVDLLARAGAAVAFTYRGRADAAGEVVTRVADRGGPGGPPVSLQADVSSREDCDRVVEQAVRALGHLDLFVANAGIWPSEDVALADMPDDRWRETLAVNLDSVFYGCRAALPAMRDGGRIVVVGSTAGQRGEAFHADYAATKGALIAFVKSVCVEAAPRGITVNCVAPGWIDTEMSQPVYADRGGTRRREIEAGIPLGRVATAEEVAGPIVFLCSDLARHITGEVVNVNGGSVLCG